MAVLELSSLPMKALIGGPMVAAIEAQAQSAQTTVDFIQQVGFVNESTTPGQGVSDGAFGDVRNVKFTYKKTGEDGEIETHEFELPILSILPVPYLRIGDMTINFKASLSKVETFDRSVTNDFSIGTDISGKIWGVKFGLNASYKRSSETNTSSTRSAKYEYEVNVNALQDEIPAGLGRVLDILEEAIIDTTTESGGEEG